MKPISLAVATLVLLAAVPAAADWRLSGSNTLRIEHYRIDGDAAASPYAHAGTHSYNELNLGLVGRQSPGSLWRFQFVGIANDSAYRADDTGFVVERISAYHARDDVAVPFRVEFGDQWLRLSPLTLEQPLKAIRFEALPLSPVDGRQQSLMVFAGAADTEWHDFDASASQYRGASWAVADTRLGRIGANVVYHSREGDDGEGLGSEWVGSVMAEHAFDFAHQSLSASGEWAKFSGDTGPSGETRQDQAVTARLAGRDQVRPLSYEFSYQRYGEGFNPSGVQLQSDYRGFGARAGVQFASGHELQGRAQWETFGFESQNPVESDTVGLTLRGPLLDSVETSTDLMVRSRESESGHLDTRETRARVDVSMPLWEMGDTRLGMLWAGFDNRLTDGTDRVTRQVSVSQGLSSEWGDFEVSARAGLVYQEVDSATSHHTVNPTLSLAAAGDGHSFGLNLGFRRLDTNWEDGVDVDTYVLGFEYQFRQQRHTLGIEVDHELRAPDGHEDTESWRVGAFWRYSFDHTLR